MKDGEPQEVLRLVGVYHASGTLWGEVSYWLRARLGSAHCALCDITHGSVREKEEWKRCRTQLPVPMVTVHLDEQDEAMVAVTDGHTPCVLAETAHGFVMLVGADQLAACAGSPTCLVDAITTNADMLGLRLA